MGSFNGHFRRRFRGKSKTKKDGGQGFVTPTEDERQRFAETVTTYLNDVFESLTDESIRYMYTGTSAVDNSSEYIILNLL